MITMVYRNVYQPATDHLSDKGCELTGCYGFDRIITLGSVHITMAQCMTSCWNENCYMEFLSKNHIKGVLLYCVGIV